MPQPIVVKIRRVQKSDIEARFKAGFSSEINRMYGFVPQHTPVMNMQRATAWWTQLKEHPCAWAIEADGRLVGQVRLDNIDENDKRARMAIGLLSEAELGRGIGRQAINHVLRYAFNELNLHRIDLRVLAYNQRAIRCYQACGFIHEGTERESAFIDGDWYDDWIMSILSHEYFAVTKVSKEE